jgi:hypothetical protein
MKKNPNMRLKKFVLCWELPVTNFILHNLDFQGGELSSPDFL